MLYLQLHRVSGDSSHLQRSLDYVKRALRNLNGRKVTFLCGDAGPLAVAAVVHHRLKNQADSKDCITKYDTNVIFLLCASFCLFSPPNYVLLAFFLVAVLHKSVPALENYSLNRSSKPRPCSCRELGGFMSSFY